MKKIMMTLAAVAVAATMNAQVYLGGTLGLGFENKLTDKDGNDATGMTFQITTLPYPTQWRVSLRAIRFSASL